MTLPTRPLLSRAFAACLLTLVTVLSTSPADAATRVSSPTADSFVSQAAPDDNFGLWGALRIQNHGDERGKHSFLRFDIPPLAGEVLSARLELTVHTSRIEEVGLFEVSLANPWWHEQWITWNNWGAGSSILFLSSRTDLAPGTRVSFDVTSTVRGLAPHVAGYTTTPLTFGLGSSDGKHSQAFHSRESTTPPTLVIETVDPPPRDCRTPSEILGELEDLLTTGSLRGACNWERHLNWAFREHSGPGSENLPVLAAAVALHLDREHDGHDWAEWFATFLDHQVAGTSPAKVDRFKSTELFSNVYDPATTTGILAARSWAGLQASPDVQIATLLDRSARYLRATWFAEALAASPTGNDIVYRIEGANQQIETDGDGRSCPTIPLIGTRWNRHASNDSRRWLFVQAVGSYSDDCYKDPAIKRFVDLLIARAPSTGPGGSFDLFGLDAAARGAIRAVVGGGLDLAALGDAFSGIDLVVDIHFMRWADGRRATWFEGQQPNNLIRAPSKGTAFAVFFDPLVVRQVEEKTIERAELSVLHVARSSASSCVDTAARRIHIDTCGSGHWMELPPGATQHVVLGTTGFRTCSPSSLSC